MHAIRAPTQAHRNPCFLPPVRYGLFNKMPLKFLTRQEIENALARLSELAAAEHVRLEMTVYGGAAMLLAYDARPVTKDIDAIVHPPAVARRLVNQVANELGLHEGWLNDDVKAFVSGKEAKNELALQNLNSDGLHITRPTAKYLLAMKVMANRMPQPGYAGDLADIETLLRITRMDSTAAVEKVVDNFFPDTVLPDRTIATLKTLFAKIHAEDQEAQSHEQPNQPTQAPQATQTQPAAERPRGRAPRR